jgi:cell division septum initiation protein DivIVA
MQFLPDAAQPIDGDTVEAVTTAVTHVALALDELKDQLEVTNRRVGEVMAAQISEADLGRLFVRAAEFADATMAQAEEEARQLVADAVAQAERLVANARLEAHAIITEAHDAPLSDAVAEQVRATIDRLVLVNDELVKELDFLHDVVQPHFAVGPGPTEPPSLPYPSD